jgi:hypothetical protein
VRVPWKCKLFANLIRKVLLETGNGTQIDLPPMFFFCLNQFGFRRHTAVLATGLLMGLVTVGVKVKVR